MDRLEAMQAVVHVADHGTFAAAARALRTSPASITRAVQAAEAEFDRPLFIRTTRAVRLTPAGVAFVEHARTVLHAVEQTRQAVTGDRDAPRGTLRITAPALFGRRHIAPVALGLMRDHPALRIDLQLHDRVLNLIEARIDVAVRIGDLTDSGLVARKLGQLRRVLCASPAYLRAHGVPQAPADLRHHRTLALHELSLNSQWSFRDARRRVAVRIDPHLLTTAAEVAVAAAVQGHGLLRCLSYQVADELRRGDLVLTLERCEPAPAPVHIVHAATRSPAVRLFSDRTAAALASADLELRTTPRLPR